MSSIQMALVAYQKTILVHDKLSPSARPAVQKIVENLPKHDHKVAYEYQGVKYHCLVENQLIYVCGTAPDCQLRTAFAFLAEIKGKFRTSFAGSASDYPRGADLNPTACAKFSTQIAAAIRMFNENPESDKIGKIKTQIEGVRQLMLNNIDEVMERGEKIDTIVNATEDLSTTAQSFEDNSRTLKRAMIIRNLKLLAAIIVALIILGLIISWIACGINYKKCKSDDPPAPPPGPPGPAPATTVAATTTTLAPTTTTAAPTTTTEAPTTTAP
uniref:V-SNARE coiled-coil homology domain-containing protein n=1 Tax=Neobodo designis TaxID=312471 RepID=A0A7S1QMY4_NEODS|mmetsp:Transcript_48953/g.151194  ORF Transcript_48953/g.151194 Transcript_48953/m.151194 type:complete len:271 (+) Transcript_48953:60-872(+)|eukprot:CAMPEP_0174850456 /NCGR_PEP_ID=MMETSP1114-20130205/19443_1 /TAXON_ID=312471 /ORGANISM="Neobodo designis, Strain CCAP 1951/1" /LENGTH=270 /DNA_ID=CAMNT_0016084917 /DNA_START=57 /DNA_END=869 /DNA_ORIENTATION=+